MDIYAATLKGLHKEKSEDSIIIKNKVLYETVVKFKKVKFPFIIAVSDGVGGNAGGRQASQFIANKLASYKFNLNLSEENIKNFIETTNKELIEYANKMPGKEKMAATLSGIICSKEKSFIFHVGNTRIYSIIGNYLKQLTKDHTTYQWLKDIGNYEEAEFCNKSEITNCMGGGNSNYLKRLTIFEINSIGNMIFTSDGIHEYIELDELENIINENPQSDELCETIAELAKNKGSLDDRTIIILKP